MVDIQFIGSNADDFQGTDNDIVFTAINDLTLLTGSAYVKQKVIMLLLSTIGKDPYYSGYGTELPFILFHNIIDPVVQSAIVNAILSGLAYLQASEPSTNPSDQIKSVDDIQLSADVSTNTINVTLVLSLNDNKQIALSVGG